MLVYFSQVISKFALNHEETVTRRLLMSKKIAEEVNFKLCFDQLDA